MDGRASSPTLVLLWVGSRCYLSHIPTMDSSKCWCSTQRHRWTTSELRGACIRGATNSADPSRTLIRGKKAVVTTHRPRPRQVDGDLLDEGYGFVVRLEPAALSVQRSCCRSTIRETQQLHPDHRASET